MPVRIISHGTTFKGTISFIGLGMIVVGIFLFVSGIRNDDIFPKEIAGILSLIIGSFSFLSIRGVMINLEQKQIKPYFNFCFFKIGKWQPLDRFNLIKLKYIFESQTMNSRGNSTNYQTRSFDIILISSSLKNITLKEFPEYHKAVEFLNEYGILLGLPIEDKYKDILS